MATKSLEGWVADSTSALKLPRRMHVLVMEGPMELRHSQMHEWTMVGGNVELTIGTLRNFELNK